MINKQNDNKVYRQEKTDFRQYLPAVYTVAIGMLVSILLFAIVKKWEHQNLRIEFESRSQGYARAVESTIHDYIEGLKYLGDFFNNSEQVTRKEFSEFSLSGIARHPGIQAFGWNPLILNSERAGFESRAQEEGFDNFMITERAENNKLARAALRDEYVVVYYIEPLESNKPALGYDIASDVTRRNAIYHSFETGNMSVTDRITLVQEKGDQFGVLLLLPIYHKNVSLKSTEDYKKHRKGFVVEVLRIGDLVEKALQDFSDEGIDMYLYDLSAEEANSFLYYRPTGTSEMTKQHLQKKEIQKGLYWSKKVGVANHQWQMLFSPSSFYLNFQKSWQSWFVLAGSLMMTGLLALYLSRKSIYTDKIEQQLHKNKQILQTTMDGYIVADTTGSIIEVNESYCRMSGYTQEELLKMNIQEIEVTLSTEEIEQQTKKMVEQGSDRFETRHMHKDGSIIDLDVSVVIMQSQGTSLVAAFVRDITDHKMTEDRLREERNRAQKYLDIAGVMIAILDVEGRVTLVNQRGSEILGYREKDIIGKNWFEYFLPERLKKEVYQVFLQLMAGDITPVEYYENPVLIKGGVERVIAFHNTVLNDTSGKITGVLFSGEDITERKKAEEALLLSTKHYQTLFNNTPVPIWEEDITELMTYLKEFRSRGISDFRSYIDQNPEELQICMQKIKIKDVNRATLSLHKAKDRKELLDNLEKVFTEKSFEVFKEEIIAVAEGKLEFESETEVKTLTGERLDVFLKVFVDIDKRNTHRALLATIDITDIKRIEKKQNQLTKKLILKNKELEQVLYVTSHDLRSPLVNVEGYSRELEYSLKELMSSLNHADVPSHIKEKIALIVNEDIPESVHYIRTSVSKMETLLRGILSLSRMGRYELTIAEIDMNAMMADIVDSHRFRLNEFKIKTDVSMLPQCKGDSSQINQVFSNLLDNAVKYTDAKRPGFIHISGYKDKNQSVYCIEDNGIGISPDHQDKIFEIFHQLEPNRVKGEGMGLTIAHRIIEKHNGNIWVESEVGKGSKFFVSLPS